VRPNGAAGIQHLVIGTRGERILIKQVRHGRLGRQQKDSNQQRLD
jgi:hypothetical protein